MNLTETLTAYRNGERELPTYKELQELDEQINALIKLWETYVNFSQHMFGECAELFEL